MKNLISKKVKIDNFLTTDPFEKRGEIGTIVGISEIDEENADITIQFEDGVVGMYQLGTFEIL